MKTNLAAIGVSTLAGLAFFLAFESAARSTGREPNDDDKAVAAKSSAASEKRKEPMLAHNVYFKLKDSSDAARKKLVAACHKYLADHPGVEFYAAGGVSDLSRPVNDRDWDVALHVVFTDRAAHDKYQVAESHQKFIAENKDGWEKVRVFDSDVTGAD